MTHTTNYNLKMTAFCAIEKIYRYMNISIDILILVCYLHLLILSVPIIKGWNNYYKIKKGPA
jgi:hypothetical protein